MSRFHPRRDGGGHLLCFRYAFGRHRVDLGAERCRGDFVLRLESRQQGWWSSPRARRRPGGCKSATPGTFRSAFLICRTTACSMRTRSSNTNGRRASTAISREQQQRCRAAEAVLRAARTGQCRSQHRLEADGPAHGIQPHPQPDAFGRQPGFPLQRFGQLQLHDGCHGEVGQRRWRRCASTLPTAT